MKQPSIQRERRIRAGALTLAGGLALAAVPLVAVEPPPRAVVEVFDGGIDFHLAGAYRSAVLEVSGEGLELRSTFGPGTVPTIGRLGPSDKPLPDGTYKWRLSLIPDAVNARALRQAADRGADENPHAWTAQSGSFAILDGAFVDPDLVERSGAKRPGALMDAESRAVASAGRSGSDAGDSDPSVKAGVCEGDPLDGSADAKGAGSPYGAGLVVSDAPAGLDSDAALTAGARAEKAPIAAGVASAAGPDAPAVDSGRKPQER